MSIPGIPSKKRFLSDYLTILRQSRKFYKDRCERPSLQHTLNPVWSDKSGLRSVNQN